MATRRRLARVLDDNLGYVALGLAYLVATIHFVHPQRGFPRLVLLVSSGNAPLLLDDPRPLVFVLSAVAIHLGVLLVWLDVERRRVYALGMALMAAYFAGYFAWHLSGHGGFIPGREPHYHGLHPVAAVLEHLRDYPMARLSKLAEVLLFAVLAAMYRRES